MIFGHDVARGALEARLPPVALLRGPSSVGKRSLGLHLIQSHRVPAANVRDYETLSAEASREVKRFVATYPHAGGVKAVLVGLDGAQEQACNALLKVLEEPPPYARFILVASGRVPDTIVSRSEVYRLGLLSETALRQVLVQRLGMDPKAAEVAAKLGAGQVNRAQEVTDAAPQSRALVLSALKAVKDSDPRLLELAMAKWDDPASALLLTWATEARTGRWRVFSVDDSFGLQVGDVPRRLLSSLRLHARARLTARVALEALVGC